MFSHAKRLIPSFQRCQWFSTESTTVPLPQVLPHFISKSSLSSPSDGSSVKITTLKNGLTVATSNKFGMHCTIGAMVKAGPRYENVHVKGVSHFIEKLGFHSTDMFRDRDHIQATMEECNAIFDCQISRDFIVYAASGVNRNFKMLTKVLSETVLRPRISKDEFDLAARAIGFELDSLEMAPPVEPILNELLHSAAFRASNTLGLPRYCPKESIDQISRHDIMKYMTSYYVPDRMVIVGVGVDHDNFTSCVESEFLPWETSYGKEIPEDERIPPDDSMPMYFGGEMSVHRDLAQYHAPLPEMAHCAIGLEGCGTRDTQFVSACLLNSLLGGGGSFSAGGPGKGMYSRLYTNVLNRYHWVNSAQSANHAYADAGLFAISGSAEPENIHHLIRVIINELRYTAETTIGVEELARAKNQLESLLLMNLEMNPVTFEDIARQVLGSGEWKPPAYWVEKINAVTAADLQDFLARMFKSPLTMVGYGRMERWPKYSDVQEEFAASSSFPSFFKRFV